MSYHGNNDYNRNGAVDVSLQNCFLKMGSQQWAHGAERTDLFMAFGSLGAITYFLLEMVCGYIIPQNYTSILLCL